MTLENGRDDPLGESDLTHPFYNPTSLRLSPSEDDEDSTTDPFEHMPMISNFDQESDAIFLRSSPGFDIQEHGGTYQISVQVPGVQNKDDVQIEFEDDGRVLHISGRQTVEKDQGMTVMETRFDKKFTVGDNVNTGQMTTELQNGVLILTAPKKDSKEPIGTGIEVTETTMDQRAQ